MKWMITLLLLLAGLVAGCQAGQSVPERPSRIAFVTDRDGNFEVYMMERDGSNPTNLTVDDNNNALPVWSPQADALAFVTVRKAEGVAIYRMKDDGSDLAPLKKNPPINPVPMSWSPSGEWIAFGSGAGADVYIMDPTGETLTNLTNHPDQDNFEAWSPDGQQLLFTSKRDGNLVIYVVGVEGGEVTRLTELESNNGAPDWSPDGTKIAFMSDRDGDVEIYLMDTEGGNITRLTDKKGFDGHPAWSPNGTKIAFVSRGDGNNEIYVINADGTELTNLTNSPTSEEALHGDFAWSPDGKQILFHSNQDGNVEVYVMDADGSNQTNLTNNPATDFGSIWVQ